jgi:hypothetical protein
MRLRLTLASLLALVGLLAVAEQASALSCPEPKPEQQFKTADAAIIGHLLEIRSTAPLPEPGHNYGGVISAEFRWRVDEVYKGAEWFRPGDVITVAGMYFGLRLPPPEPPDDELGAVLRLFEGHWIWEGMMCDWISVADLRRVAAEAQAPVPAEEVLIPLPTTPESDPPVPPVEPGPIAFQVAGRTGYELRKALAKGIELKVGCATPCKAVGRLYVRAGVARRLELTHSSDPVLVARGSVRPSGAETKRLHLRFLRRARERLKSASKLNLSLMLAFTSTPGGTRTLARPLTLERRSLTLERAMRH